MAQTHVVLRILELVVEVSQQHAQVGSAREASEQFALETGRRLVELKPLVRKQYGAWLPWIAANLPFDVRSAQRYMRLAQPKTTRVSRGPVRSLRLGRMSEQDFRAFKANLQILLAAHHYNLREKDSIGRALVKVAADYAALREQERKAA